MIMLELKNLFSQVYVALFNTSSDAARAFMRLQEHYESTNPQFRGQLFDKASYLRWYKKEFRSVYEDDWSGFNVPDWATKPFLTGQMGELDEFEKPLIEAISKLKGKFYLIGHALGDDRVEFHESLHGLFYVDEVYRSEATKIVGQFKFAALKAHLSRIGYYDAVLVDECQAYCLADEGYLREKMLWGRETELAKELLSKLYAERSK